MSSSTVDKNLDIFDVKKTPEIYPMTSVHESFEYFHEKVNQLNKRVYENSAMMQRLGEQVQLLSTRTHKTKASTQKEEPTVDDLCGGAPEPQLKSPVKAEKPDVLSMLLRRFSSEPVREPEILAPAPLANTLYQNYANCLEPEPAIEPAIEPAWEPLAEPLSEPEADIEPERPETESIHFRRFSEQQLEAVKEYLRPFQEPELGSVQESEAQPDAESQLDPDSEQDLSPCLWQRLSAKFDAQQEPVSEPVQERDVEPPPKRAEASARGLKRLSLCMMPPDEMQDVLDVISPAPAPSPALGAAVEDTSLFLR
jgi:hypothetical protein